MEEKHYSTRRTTTKGYLVSETVTSRVVALRGILALRCKSPWNCTLLLGVSNQLTVTNQNLLELDHCIDIGKTIKRLVVEAREIMNYVYDIRADLQQNQQHQPEKGSEKAIRAVVNTMGQEQSALVEQAKQFK